MTETLRVHHIEPASRANGPGLRAVVWVQGCTLGCPGCFNPETHQPTSGKTITVGELFQEVRGLSAIEGITISGGEPLQQLPALSIFLASIRSQTRLSVVMFTGFSWVEVNRIPGFGSILPSIDVLIAGRYLQEKRLARSLAGSSNKTNHFLTDRYSQADLEQIPEAEVLISADGQVTLSGIDPIQW